MSGPVPSSPVEGEKTAHTSPYFEFERANPDLFYKIGKGKLSPSEPLYGAVIETAGGAIVGEGESDVSLQAAFEAAMVDGGVSISETYPTVTKADVIFALEVLCRANGADLDEWTGGILPSDDIEDALKAARAEGRDARKGGA